MKLSEFDTDIQARLALIAVVAIFKASPTQTRGACLAQLQAACEAKEIAGEVTLAQAIQELNLLLETF